jgi:DNA-binding GntR family transcriptional regulator
MIVRQSDNHVGVWSREETRGKSLSDNGGMPPAERASDLLGSPFDSLSLEHSSTVDRVADELRRALFEGELESGTPLREVALAESLGVSRPTVREALALLVAEGLATREPNRGVSVARPDPASVRDVSRARAVLETAGVRHWPAASEEARAGVRRALAAYEQAVADGASYRELNQRHLAIHLSLVGLTESPRLVGMAESVVAELRLALAQIDRVRRNARDQAGSHHHLLDLLEAGEIEVAAADLADHLSGAEDAIIERLELD